MAPKVQEVGFRPSLIPIDRINDTWFLLKGKKAYAVLVEKVNRCDPPSSYLGP